MVIQIMYKQGWLRFEVFEKLPRDIHKSWPPRLARRPSVFILKTSSYVLFIMSTVASTNINGIQLPGWRNGSASDF
jgi:hypothetical protein